MKNHSLILGIAFLMLFAGVDNALADAIGTNITIADGSAAPGYVGIGQAGEDDETEGVPPTYQSQNWDLEGVFLNSSNMLTMIGGYKFDTGVLHAGTWYTSGDIFLDVLGSSFIWDYGIRMNFATHQYDVLALNAGTTFISPTDVPGTTPWKVAGGYTISQSGLAFTFGEVTNSGFSGWQAPGPGPDGDPNWRLGDDKHYAVGGFDVDFLGGGTDFQTHFTMMCGNDLLIGEGTTAIRNGPPYVSQSVPEPSTLLMLGSVLLLGTGLTALRRQMHRQG